VTSSWFFFFTYNDDARTNTYQIYSVYLSSVFCMLPAASGLLLVVIVLSEHYRAPICTVVSVLSIRYYQLYADCVHVEI
jgi:hypothetical protein